MAGILLLQGGEGGEEEDVVRMLASLESDLQSQKLAVMAGEGNRETGGLVFLCTAPATQINGYIPSCLISLHSLVSNLTEISFFI